ncbi:MAG TPA: transcriptional repressor LexA [Patescibacteria group bacterium]|nr:transcriptional repressor LexA [Patescibacteria group bacterium]
MQELKPLTKKQKKTLDFITSFIAKNGYSPSLKEIAKFLGATNLSTAQYFVEELEKKDYLKRAPYKNRGIIPTNKTKTIPLLGNIAAGKPIEPIENPEDIEIPQNIKLDTRFPHYALKVVGDSMFDMGIIDNDIVLIRHQITAESGDTVVAITEKGATLKIFRKSGGKIFLEPRSKKFKKYSPKKLEIRGKFCGLIRKSTDLSVTNGFSLSRLREEFHELTIQYIQNTNREYRKTKGQYFTPRSIREKLFKKLPKNKKGLKILDPACGTGEFLLTASKYFKNPSLFGWDIEEELIKRARVVVPRANLETVDSLKHTTKEKFDFIIGNPPYFEFKPENMIKKKYQEVVSGRPNIFAFFIKLSLDLLRPGGYLAFVLPPSMNNGAYFADLRKYIIKHSNIEYLSILNSPKLFHQALQTTMLLVLKKGENKGNYIFKKNGITIFTENPAYLKKSFQGKTTLSNLGFQVKTGRLVWNQNKNLLTKDSKKGIPLIWAHNITSKGLRLTNNPKKPQYIKTKNYDTGPAIVVNRITGAVNSAKLKVAVVPPNMKFIGENHVNVIFLPNKTKISTENLVKQLRSKDKLKVIQYITGNTQISKTELENLFPIDLR